ncbi:MULTISPECIES: hypothetical protein [unclassified Spirillospora]|uniref:hypothetical protein n=1 Tax=unclassified Spirillospora TaxID=2642701 RepID=UPI003712D8DC
MTNPASRPSVTVNQVAAGDVLVGDLLGLPGHPSPTVLVRHIGPISEPITVHHRGTALRIIPVMLTWEIAGLERREGEGEPVVGRVWLTMQTRVTRLAAPYAGHGDS